MSVKGVDGKTYNGLHASHMMDVCKGRRYHKQYKGWRKYYE